MNLDFTPEYQAFRAKVRDFLETHKNSAPRMSDRGVRSEKRKVWQKTLLEHGYAARTLPKEYGGYGAAPDALKSRIIAEEFSRAKMPGGISGQGINMLVPTLLELGTQEQKQKYNEMVQTMMDDYGYTPESAEEVLIYASNNLWRDS